MVKGVGLWKRVSCRHMAVYICSDASVLSSGRLWSPRQFHCSSLTVGGGALVGWI